MSVRIRMKKMGRTHRPFFRICAMDKRSPRDGRALEELGTYNPTIADPDARAVLKKDRIDYWLSVGAQPSEKMAVLIKKYGTDGTHLDAQAAALEKLSMASEVLDPGAPVSKPKEEEPEAPAEEAAAPAAEGDAPAAEADAPAEEASAEESKPEEAPAEESGGEEAKAEDAPAEEATEEKPAEG